MAVPVITSINPIYGFFRGGTSVVFAGSGFQTGVTSLVVSFDGVNASNVVVASDVAMTVVVPEISSSAAVPVVVTTNGGVSNVVTFYATVSPSVPGASYSVNNPFFDPTAKYVVFAEWTFATPPVTLNIPNTAHAGSLKYLMVDTADNNKLYFET